MFRHFSDREGAPITTVLGFTQDHEGFVWLATTNGLFQYDSKSFKKYRHDGREPGSIASNYIENVYCDARGDLWILTFEGLCLYNRETDSFITFRYDAEDPGSLSGNRVFSMAEDSEGKLWVGTNRGLNRLEINSGNVTFVRSANQLADSARLVKCIVAGNEGELWLATDQGLVKMKNDAGRHVKGSENGRYPDGVRLNTLLYSSEGRIWLGTSRGLFQFDIELEKFSHEKNILQNNIFAIAEDKNQNLWAASELGLIFLNTRTGDSRRHLHDRKNPNSLVDDALMAAYTDANGGLWIGSYYLGASYMQIDAPGFTLFPFDLNNPLYESFFNGWMGPVGERMWAVSNDYSRLALFNVDHSLVEMTELKGLEGKKYYTFFMDVEDVLWCGGQFQISAYDLKTGRRTDYDLTQNGLKGPNSGRVNFIYEDSRGGFWVGGSFGLVMFDRSTGTVIEADRSESFFSALEDSKGNLWFGGRRHVVKRAAGTDNTQKFEIGQRPGANNIKCVRAIAEDPSGRIWFASEAGLCRFENETGKIQFYTDDAPTLLDYTLDIQSDEQGYLWINHEYELIRYHPDKRTIQRYNYQDGLPLNGLLILGTSRKSHDGLIYFQTSKGAFRFDPEEIRPREGNSKIVLTELRLFDEVVTAGDHTRILEQSIETTREITFQHAQNIFSLDFALLSFSRSERNQYAYRMEGFQTNWNYVQTPTAMYTNLPSGTYTFVLRAANGDGYWSAEPLRVKIVVLPPWWKTWYAYVCYFLLVAAVVYVITRFFWLRSAFKKENELYQSKIDFFTNISHEIRTHLTLISGPLEKAFQSSLVGSDTRTFLTYTKNNTDKLLDLVNELLDFRKMKSGKTRLQVGQHDVGRTIKNVLAAFEHVADEKAILVDFVAPKNPVLLWFDLSQLQKVFYNLLGNAFKFTPENGRIKIVVKEGFNEVTIRITDNGPGISPKYIGKIFTSFFQGGDIGETDRNKGYGIGLALSKSIIDRHHGDLSVISRVKPENGNGETSFTIRLMTGNWYLEDADIVVAPEPAKSASGNQIIADTLAADQISPSGRESTLLFIEDNDELRSFMVELFRDNYRILEAADGREGFAIAQKKMPDVIVCDMMMPQMNGREVCRKLKSDPGTRHIPVIIISAQNANSHILEGLEAGADGYMIKPFDFKILDAKIRTQLRAREATRLQQSRMVSFEPGQPELKDPDGEFIETLRELIVHNLSDTSFGVEQMAFEMGVSVSVLYRKLRALTGMTVNSFTKSIRMKRGRQLLESGHYNVSEVANEVGYEDVQYFSREYKKMFGEAPSETRRIGGENNYGINQNGKLS